MQASKEGGAVIHRCERCGTVITVANPPSAAAQG